MKTSSAFSIDTWWIWRVRHCPKAIVRSRSSSLPSTMWDALVRSNTRVEPTAQNSVASLPALWVPSLRSGAQVQRYADELVGGSDIWSR